MFQAISDFIDSITAYQINIPLWMQIAVIIIVMISLSIGAYIMRDYFDISYMRSGMFWFVFIAVLNLSTLLAIFLYYNKKSNSYVGVPGYKGKKGKMGKKGVSVTCSNCKTNLYLQSTRKNDVICTLNTFTTDFKTISDNAGFFQNIFDNGDSISYDNFVNGIILGQTVNTKNTDSVNRFKTLMTPTSIAYQLIQTINDSVTKASTNTYGTFRNPNGKVGYMSLGDAVYGGLEKFELNAFMVNGDVMYPSSHTKLVSFTSYNAETQDTDTYTIWRPIGQSITDTGFKNSKQTFNYYALGDMCRFGTTAPKVNETATIKETCLSPIPSSDLILVFLYVGALTFTDETNNIDYTKTDSYLIKNKVANNVEMFSVWRTPLNTFITNCNSQNKIINNSFIFNMYNNAYDALNNYGNISTEYKNKASILLQSIPISKILIAAIFCKHYEIELRKEIVYYFNRYQSQVPEFKSIKPATASFGTIMNIIEKTQKEYKTYNQNLIYQASLSLKKGTTYDESKERRLPQQLMTIYNYINDKLLTISVEIENASNLLDVINVVFDNGIEARIAIDSDGIAQGGTLINEIQHTLLMICKMLMPPTQTAYIIKDECLGTFALDRDRDQIIKDFTTQLNKFNKFTDKMASNPNKYSTVMPNVMQYETLMNSQIGQLCGHIENYSQKIVDLNLEEFTTSRIQQLIKIYTQMNLYFRKIFSNVVNVPSN